jgi:hypothetical protein
VCLCSQLIVRLSALFLPSFLTNRYNALTSRDTSSLCPHRSRHPETLYLFLLIKVHKLPVSMPATFTVWSYWNKFRRSKNPTIENIKAEISFSSPSIIHIDITSWFWLYFYFVFKETRRRAAECAQKYFKGQPIHFDRFQARYSFVFCGSPKSTVVFTKARYSAISCVV